MLPQDPSTELEAAARASMKGDLQAMGELVDLTHHRLRGYLRTICFNTDAVDDLAQETYVTAFRKIRQLSAPESVMAYLLAIAKNHAMNHNRKAGRRANIEENHLEEIADRLLQNIETADFDTPAEIGDALEHCMDKLAPTERDLLHQRYAQGRDSGELSARTGETRTAIRTRLMRLRSRLRNCIREQLALGGKTPIQSNP